MPFLTVFTPVYNRAYIISQLYHSLCRQTLKDFEWIIVDDGSTDDIDTLVKRFISENIISVRYICQSNGGKHRAINRGIKEAAGEFFFIVDSDDYITDDAVEWIWITTKTIRNNNDFAGISGIRINPDGTKIGGGHDFGVIDANAIDIRLKHGIKGDLAEIFKTEVLRNNPFPEFDGESFCPEALVWYRIARQYKMRFCHKGIYVCEYLPDGLTAKITRIRRMSPRASMTFYAEHFHDTIPVAWRIKAAINFWRFQLTPYRKQYHMISLLSFLGWLPGKIMSLFDNTK